jgi:hypothetical protein
LGETIIVCLPFVNVGASSAYQNGDRNFSSASSDRKRSGRRQQSLHIESHSSAAEHRRPGNQKKAGTRPVPAATLATWQGQKRPIIVDLDIVAAGTEETYSYMCVMTNGAAFVRRVML